MTTTQYPYSDYSSSDYYNNYYNQSHSTQMQMNNNNNISNEYQQTQTSNWNHLQYNQPHDQHYPQQCYNTNVSELNTYNQNNSGYYQQQHNRISSSTQFNGNPHLFSNHNYPVNRTTINEYSDKQNPGDGYKQMCDMNNRSFKNNDFAYVNKMSSNNNNNAEFAVEPFPKYQKIEQPVNEVKNEQDSPALRALLTNKNLRYSPNYSSIHNQPKRRKRAHNLSEPILTPNESVNIDNVALSPHKTEDSLDFLDSYTPFSSKQQPYQQQQTTPISDMSIKAGFEYVPQTHVPNNGFSPSRMTSENLTTQTSITNVHTNSPMSKYVDGISTPPLSPKETDGVNQNMTRAKSDTSSSEKQWEPEAMAECK